MTEPIQLWLGDDMMPFAQEFAEWKQTPGAGHVLRDLYRLAARYAARYAARRQRVSMKLLYELERDRIHGVRSRLRARGVKLGKWKGYALNNNLHAHIARHIVSRRPEWAGMFEERELGAKRKGNAVLVRVARKEQTA